MLSSEASAAYIRHIRFERGRSQTTWVGYTSNLNAFARWLTARGLPDPPASGTAWSREERSDCKTSEPLL